MNMTTKLKMWFSSKSADTQSYGCHGFAVILNDPSKLLEGLTTKYFVAPGLMFAFAIPPLLAFSVYDRAAVMISFVRFSTVICTMPGAAWVIENTAAPKRRYVAPI